MKTPYYNVPNLQKIADLQAEIERLKALITEMVGREVAAREIAQLMEDCRKKDDEIERLKAANLVFSNTVALSEREIERLKGIIRD